MSEGHSEGFLAGKSPFPVAGLHFWETVLGCQSLMAIIKSAKRAIRVSARHRVYNLRRMDTMRDEVKSVKKLVAAKDIAGAEKSIAQVYKAIDKAAKRGVIKKNTASRKKSRLMKGRIFQNFPALGIRIVDSLVDTAPLR